MKSRFGSPALGMTIFWTFCAWYCIFVSTGNACGPTIILRDPTFFCLLSGSCALSQLFVKQQLKNLSIALPIFCHRLLLMKI